ncbi:MAG: TIM barrel protein [Amaricoccus sp.]|uniref:TIM barrel protein n=1 Tax=Amaricoccus sp. TaxID=1872485 RepID=UPI0039E25160
MKTALNQMTTPTLPFAAFLDLAASLGCVGVEARNDLGRPLFDGAAPAEAGAMVRDRGLRLLGVSQVYPFNAWSDAIAAEVAQLIAAAGAAGGETVSLIPRNDGTETGEAERRANLARALAGAKPLLADAGMVALVEPLGFPRSSLRSKAELVAAIDAIDGRGVFRLVHDTFHHTLAGGGAMFPKLTGIVHISGVVAGLPTDRMEDEHRVLVDAGDRLGNVEQIAALRAAGYDGAFSYECFSPEIHALADPATALRASFDFLEAQLTTQAA